jgi:FMN-dependent oxidoreductase (nitrilotriacetate monooxygenase family)
MGKHIYLNAFDMNCVVHQTPGLWTYPSDQAAEYKTLDYWVKLAKLLEKGKFDGLFLADVLGVYDVYRKSNEGALKQAAQLPVNEPTALISAMAYATKHLGFGVTVSTTYEKPYAFARKFSTLDHLTNGRIAWNIVTSYLESGSINLGLEEHFTHETRYDIADEFLEVCYKLWEGSWEEGAVVKDKEKGIFTLPDRVHPINHKGKWFSVPGVHLSEPSPQRTPVLFQAGASAPGRAFAAKHAECIFTSFPTKKVAADYVKKMRAQIAAEGRDPQSILIFNLFTPIVGRTEKEAEEKLAQFESYVNFEGAATLFSGWTGIDVSAYEPEQPIEFIATNSVRSALEKFTISDPDRKWTVEEVVKFVSIGGMGPVTVGSPEQVADFMEEWIDDTGMDGFNMAYVTTPGTFADFIDLVIPVLQERDLFKTDYSEGTYREKLFKKSHFLPDEHYGAQYRKTSQKESLT